MSGPDDRARPWVILLAYRCRKDLPNCLRALSATEGGPPPLVVVDNGCPERSYEGVEGMYPSVELVRSEKNLGFARGAMLGIRRALALGAEDVLLLNPDAFPEPPWLEELLRAADAFPDAGLLGSLILDEDGAGPDSYQASILAREGMISGRAPGSGSEPVDVSTAIGAALLIRGEVLREVGGFDPLYFVYGEETDLAIRARRHGFRVLLVPRSRVRHRSGGCHETPRLRLAARWLRMRADGLLLLKRPHLSIRTGLIDLAARTITRGWAEVRAGNPVDALLRVASVPWLLSRLPAVRRSRRAEAAGPAHAEGLFEAGGGAGIPGRSGPRVAFVVAVRNGEDTLAEALRSALGQTLPDIEVIVVDDGSTDGTTRVAKRVARSDSRVKVESTSNRGPGAARNRGVRLSRAPYLVFLDHDDVVPPEKARIQAEYLEAHPGVSVVYSRSRVGPRDSDGTGYAVTEDGATLAAELLAGGDRGFPCHAALVRRSAFLDVGGFRERRPLVEDLDLWIRMAAAGHHFEFLAEPAVRYRRSAESRSTRALEVTEGRLPSFGWLLRHLPRQPRERRRSIRRRARYRCLALAGRFAELGRTGRARRLVLRSLLWARRPGELAETLAGLVRPRRFAAHAGAELEGAEV